MPRTPDRTPGVEDQEGTNYERTSVAAAPGQVRFDDAAGRFSMHDDAGEFDPRTGGGISEAQHRALRDLIHFIDDGPACGFATGAFKETLPAGAPFPTSIIWWESNAKTEKIVELAVTYTGAFPTTEIWSMYDTDGTTVLCTVTDTIAYSGAFEVSRTRAIA
jgi:hypothetical protein